MQVLGLPLSSWEGLEGGGSSSSEGGRGNAQEKMRRLMDLPATDDLEWTRHDRWTALMEVVEGDYLQGNHSGQEKPPVDTVLGYSAILPGQ